MNKYNNPRLLNAVVSGTGMKHPIQPHVVVGDVSNGFIRGDLMDANAIVEHINNIIDGAPDTLDTLKEAADRIAALEHDTQDYEVNNTLANKVWNTMRGLLAVVVKDGPVEEQAIVLNWNNTVFDPHDEGRYGSLEIGVATSQKPGLMSTADKAALGAASAASAEIPQIKQTIEDNELTVAAALNDLNSRVAELEPDEDKIPVFIYFSPSVAPPYSAAVAFPGYIKDNELVIYATLWYCNANTNTEVHKGQFPQHQIFPIFCDNYGNALYVPYGPAVYSSLELLDANVINYWFRGTAYAEVVRRFPNVNNMSIELVDTPFEPKAKLPKFESYVTIPYIISETGREYNINLTVEISSSDQEFNFVSGRYNVLALEVDGVLVSPATYVTGLASGLHTIKAVVKDSGLGNSGKYSAPYPYNTTYAGLTKSFDIARGANMIEGFSAFNGTSITIPDTVLYIKNGAFTACPNLKEVIIEGESYVISTSSNYTVTNAVSDADSVFLDCPSLESIYVKDHLVSWYKTDSCWRNYAEYIKPISEYYETH